MTKQVKRRPPNYDLILCTQNAQSTHNPESLPICPSVYFFETMHHRKLTQVKANPLDDH